MDFVVSLVTLAALVLLARAIYLWRRGNGRKQAGLMLVLAAVMIVNVLIWAIPDGSGTAPIDRVSEGPGR